MLIADLNLLRIAVTASQHLYNRIHREPSAIGIEIAEMTSRLEAIGQALNAECLSHCQAAAIHLTRAAQLSIEIISTIDNCRITNLTTARNEQLESASGIATLLIARPKDGSTSDVVLSPSNASVRTIGYYILYHYFVLRGILNFANAEVYRCGKEHPIHALIIFGPSFFGEAAAIEYAAIVDERSKLPLKTISACDKWEADSVRDYDNKRSTKEIAIGIGAMAAGLAAFAATTAVSTIVPFLAPTAPIAGVATVRALTQNSQSDRNSTIGSFERAAERHRAAIRALLDRESQLAQAILDTSAKCLNEFDSITPAGLDRIENLIRHDVEAVDLPRKSTRQDLRRSKKRGR